MEIKSSNLKIKVLSFDNYLEWKSLIQAVLEIEECITISDENEIKFKDSKKGKARGLIITHLDSSNLALVDSIRQPKEIWDTLEMYHWKLINSMKMQIQSEYGIFKINEGEEIESYIKRFQELTRKWESLGNKLTDEGRALKFLQGYQHRNPTLVTILLNKEKTLTYGDAIAAILHHHKELEPRNEQALNVNKKKKNLFQHVIFVRRKVIQQTNVLKETSQIIQKVISIQETILTIIIMKIQIQLKFS